MPGVAISKTKRVTAKAMVDLGVPIRQVAKELGIGKSSVFACAHDPYLDPANVAHVKGRIIDRMVVSSDRFLTQSLDGLKDLNPYQAMLCSAIALDKYHQAAAMARGQGGSSITNILIQIDQSLRSTTISSVPANDPNAT